MNFVGILGSETDVLKTGGVGTCVAIAIQYRHGEGAPQYALAHVPYDSDALIGNSQSKVDRYIESIFVCLNNPSQMSIRVLENTSNKMTGMITRKLDEYEGVCQYAVFSYGGCDRMNVVILRQQSQLFGKLFCYASKKTEFHDESELASDALSRNTNIVSVMDVMKRQDKHSFRRHADLYAKARSSLGSGYTQATNPYTVALKKSHDAGFSPVLANTETFTSTKRAQWTKKNAKPAFVIDYLAWQNGIASRVLDPLPDAWPVW